MPRLCWRSICLVASTFVSVFVYASSGDREERFQNCVADCQQTVCDDNSLQLSLPLRITQWTCLDDCKYNCMHDIVDQAIEYGEPVQQYYGKWPFWRLLGMQEPASVLFSIMNFWAHWEGNKLVRQSVPRTHPMRKYVTLWAVANMNAWVWSAVFHTRDLSSTEKLDYFAAAAAVLVALHAVVIRLFHLYPHFEKSRLTATLSQDPREIIRNIWSSICVLTFLAHVTYLTLLPRFDYTYNMIFNLSLGVLHNILWCIYSLPSSLTVMRRFYSPSLPRSYRPPYASKVVILVGLTTTATLLEILDFSPFFRVIDAHSLWHLATVPLIIPWYKFMIQDSLDDGWRSIKL